MRDEPRKKTLMNIKKHLFIAAAGLLALLMGCGRSTNPKKDNCLLITLDTTRADALNCYNPGVAQTPSLDALAAEGLLCEACFSPIPITLPAHAAIFYSRLPHQVGVFNNGERVIHRKDRPALAEIFQSRGYLTSAFVSMGVLQAEFGLDSGFAEYAGRFPVSGRYYLTAGEVNDRVFPWLEQVGKRPFFLWLHYSDPHAPYHPPGVSAACGVWVDGRRIGDYTLDETRHDLKLELEPGPHKIEFRIDNPDRKRAERKQARFRLLELIDSEGRSLLDIESARGWSFNAEAGAFLCAGVNRLRLPAARSPRTVRLSFRGALSLSSERLRERYRAEIEYLDAQLGRLLTRLTELKLMRRTHILVVGDHGEGLGEYKKNTDTRHFGHIRYLYDVYLRVPLLVRSPGISLSGRRLQGPVSLMDVAPTILDLMGWPAPADYLGRSLLGMDGSSPRALHQATFRPESDRDRFGLLAPPFHMILTPAEDRIELFDLDQDPQELTNIYSLRSGEPAVRELRRRLENGVRRILKSRPDYKPDSRTREMLRALGYIR